MRVHSILFACLICASIEAHGSAILFSNLQANALSCGCSLREGRTLGTFAGDPTEHWTAGDAFTTPSTSDFVLDDVELAVGLISGNVNSLDAFLYSDDHNSPGSLLESFRLDNRMGAFGRDHTLLTADSVRRPLLTAGRQYWLLATTLDPGTAAGWYVNNTEDIGPVGAQVNADPFCCVRTDLRDAFAILGTPIQTLPEPSSLWAVGAGVFLLLIGTIPFPRALSTPRRARIL